MLTTSEQYKKTSGNVKNFVRKGDSGKDVTYNQCGSLPRLHVSPC